MSYSAHIVYTQDTCTAQALKHMHTLQANLSECKGKAHLPTSKGNPLICFETAVCIIHMRDPCVLQTIAINLN